MTNMNTVVIAKATLTFDNPPSVGEMPSLTVNIEKDGNVLTKGYLQPFRGYCFQVSGSKNGDGDYGSSPNIHFRAALRDMSEEVCKNLLKGQALLALNSYLRRDFGVLLLTDEEYENGTSLIIDCSEIATIRTWGDIKPLPIDQFIEASYHWLFD